MNLELNQVYTFKLTTGEEMVAKVTDLDEHCVTVAEPVSVRPGPQGMGLIPSLFTADHEQKILVNRSCIAIYALTDQPVRAKYIEATTGIRVPEKKLILG